MARVAPAPDLFREKCPGEPWAIWCHLEIQDFEMDSFGATAGFLVEGTKLEILGTATHTYQTGPLVGDTEDLFRVRGISEAGDEIEGWVLSHWVDEDG
jgi:hypothetical protein